MLRSWMCRSPGKKKLSECWPKQRVSPTKNNLLNKLRNIKLREDFLTVHYPAVEITTCTKLSNISQTLNNLISTWQILQYEHNVVIETIFQISKHAENNNILMKIIKIFSLPVKSHYFWKVNRTKDFHLLHDSFLFARPLAGYMFGSEYFS